MDSKKTALFGGALLAAGVAADANADVTVHGAITTTDQSAIGPNYVSSSYAYARWSNVTVDNIVFTVNSASTVSLDILSYYAGQSWLDTEIALYHDDGDLGAEDFILSNDDSTSDLNGSATSTDAFLTTTLAPGQYIAVVASISWDGLDHNDAISGVSDVGWFFNGGGVVPTTGEYQLDIFGDVALVPSPGTLSLAGISALAACRRRRK